MIVQPEKIENENINQKNIVKEIIRKISFNNYMFYNFLVPSGSSIYFQTPAKHE